jgi:hypothetical protein
MELSDIKIGETYRFTYDGNVVELFDVKDILSDNFAPACRIYGDGDIEIIDINQERAVIKLKNIYSLSNNNSMFCDIESEQSNEIKIVVPMDGEVIGDMKKHCFNALLPYLSSIDKK